MDVALIDFLTHFLVQIFTPLLAVQFFHADLSHIPFLIAAVDSAFSRLIWKNETLIFFMSV